MILQSLHDLYARLRKEERYRIPPQGYSLQKITFKIVLSPDGELFEIQDARIPVGGRLRPAQIEVPWVSGRAGSGLLPYFLWDTAGYLLGHKPDDQNPDRTIRAFEAFREKHLSLEEDVDSPAFSAVCRFLESWGPENFAGVDTSAELGTGYGVFQIVGRSGYVHQDARIREWWEQRDPTEGDSTFGQCLLTGERAPIARTQPMIKGVIGTSGTGASIVTFNENAYESLGKRQGFNAPVGEAAAFRYVTALNAMLDGPMRDKHRIRIGDTTVAFWTDRPTLTEDVFAEYTLGGSASIDRERAQDEGIRQKLEVFLKTLRKGGECRDEIEEDPDRTRFYLLGLSPNKARISIRLFHHGTLGQLLDDLRRHHEHIRIDPQPARGKRPADPEFPSLIQLLDQTCPRRTGGKPDREKIPPILVGPLFRAVLTGARYPDGLYSAVLRRIRADRTVNYLRACVLKGHLQRNFGKELAMSLDTSRPDPAYRLGRLFGALEMTQHDALPGVKAGIRDRFYGAASAQPGSVFPRLLRTYQHHLAKLERGRVNREKLVQEILDPLQDFPTHLDLAGQGLFALGYYHQKQAFYSKTNS